ncbi:MAG: hypothetical protein EBX52_06475, partial [Proteobacteria bacterium]|nr:hypothetical protein [Pseudomonadota bacterium]
PTPASVAVPVKDAALHGCFEGTLEGSGNGTLQLFFFRALEPEEERYRLTLEQGGVRHPWQGPVGSFRALPHRPGFASGYEMPLESTRSAEIYYNSELRSWSGTLYSISGSGPSSAPRKSTGNFVLKQTNHCQ